MIFLLLESIHENEPFESNQNIFQTDLWVISNKNWAGHLYDTAKAVELENTITQGELFDMKKIK